MLTRYHVSKLYHYYNYLHDLASIRQILKTLDFLPFLVLSSYCVNVIMTYHLEVVK